MSEETSSSSQLLEGFWESAGPCAFPPGVSNFPLLSHLLLTPSSLLLLAAVCQNQYSHSCQRQLRLAHHKRQLRPHFQIKINPATSAPSDNVFDMPVLWPHSLAVTRHRHDHGSSHGHLYFSICLPGVPCRVTQVPQI